MVWREARASTDCHWKSDAITCFCELAKIFSGMSSFGEGRQLRMLTLGWITESLHFKESPASRDDLRRRRGCVISLFQMSNAVRHAQGWLWVKKGSRVRSDTRRQRFDRLWRGDESTFGQPKRGADVLRGVVVEDMFLQEKSSRGRCKETSALRRRHTCGCARDESPSRG